MPLRSPWNFLEEAIKEAEDEQQDVEVSVGMAALILGLRSDFPGQAVRVWRGNTDANTDVRNRPTED